MTEQKWVRKWNSWVGPTKVPGVFKRKEGGYLVRGRTKDPATGKDREVRKNLDVGSEALALQWLEEELERVRSGASAGLSPRMRFADYALSLAERKLVAREIKSARGRERWKYTLDHLIGGTEDVTGFGELFVGDIRPAHVEAWRTGIARLIGAGSYAPTTANGWLVILRHILKRAKRELQLPFNAAEGVSCFDTSEHEVYTEEEPNALTSEETAAFLACMKEEFPAQYAMTFLGFATGLRPSSMRPLRRSGATPDVLWDDGVILVRQSHTLKDELMKTTKTGLRQRITVPPQVMDVLRWHTQSQLTTPEQKASELLFPAEDGSFRSPSFLKKAFPIVGGLIGLKKKFTPRGMRRTFNDLARTANVEALVTRSISGHLTEQMREHYSTVSPSEQRESIGRVLRLVQSGTSDGAAPGADGDGGMHRGMHRGSSGMHSRLGVR
jgi:integrase